MKKTYSRRSILTKGSIAGAALIGAGVSGYAANSPLQETKMVFPWPYKKLDVEKTALRGYENTRVAGCMYGAFYAVAGGVADLLGAPYTDFPFLLSSYGGGGIAGWGSTCGAANGAAMAIALFHQGSMRAELTREVLAWYEETELPIWAPEKTINSAEIKKSVAGSVLCHISLKKWFAIVGKKIDSSERCIRLVADIAKRTAVLLNEAAEGKFKPVMQVSKAAASCLKCHDASKPAGSARARMNCVTCHTDAHHQPETK